MAKKKRMTSREKQELAAAKKRLQEKGLLPPNKPRLNRKKFIEEAKTEWEDRDTACRIWDVYLTHAAAFMMQHGAAMGKISPEAVGAAKTLKIAIRLRRFDLELREAGRDKFAFDELYEYIKDIINA